MRTRLVKWLCIAVLFVAFVSWRLIADYELALRVVVCAGAAIVAVQAVHAARRRWAAGFLVIAFLFNPAIPAFRLAGGVGLLAIVLAAAAFALSLTALKSQPLLSIDHGSQSRQSIAVTKGPDVSTSIVSRASQGVSEAALAGQLDEALWTAWKLRGGQRDARRAALFLKAAKCLQLPPCGSPSRVGCWNRAG
jgi:hypothetical protein